MSRFASAKVNWCGVDVLTSSKRSPVMVLTPAEARSLAADLYAAADEADKNEAKARKAYLAARKDPPR